ncbi:MAG: PorP/SprF family type IX secretion system membrane protein [Prevotellaceae bacterium]|jgi:type IX secretion system PorP/SprF family membrane protein|nr:PorP/SprF family type IX secretion system membrane protein [Prevotellaceae bacterium]
MKKIVLILTVLFSGISLYGQSDAILTQQWLSRINCNPAATGNTNDLNIFLLHRTQWSGFDDDAPQTSMLNATNYFEKINSGVGVSLSYDKEGQLNTNLNAKIAYAYHLKLGNQTLLSLGLGVNLQDRAIDWNKVKMVHPELEVVGKESKTGIDFDFGLEFNVSRFTLGASWNRIGKSSINGLNNFKNGQQLYTYARYRITACEGVDIAPTVSYVYANHMDVWEAGLTAFLLDKFWAGAAYRHDVALAFMAGFEFNMFRVGYAYDHYIKAASDLGGTHEIMLSVKIPHKR